MKLDHTDRIYKTIDASIGENKFMRILSKIDKNQDVTVEFYHYHREDIDTKDRTIKNKRNRYITNTMSISKFEEMISRFPELYSEFKILGATDNSNLTLNEVIKRIEIFEHGKIIHYDEEKNKKL